VPLPLAGLAGFEDGALARGYLGIPPLGVPSPLPHLPTGDNEREAKQ
jgi:hypothetical protein